MVLLKKRQAEFFWGVDVTFKSCFSITVGPFSHEEKRITIVIIAIEERLCKTCRCSIKKLLRYQQIATGFGTVSSMQFVIVKIKTFGKLIGINGKS